MSSSVTSNNNGIDDENDSDVEILDQGVLRASFFRQQLRLIYEIDKCGRRIPRPWPAFQRFIKEIINWHPGEELVRSTWLKLSCAEEFVKNTDTDVVEISDEDESPIDVLDNIPKNTSEAGLQNQKKKTGKRKVSVGRRNRKKKILEASVTSASSSRQSDITQEIITNILPSKRKKSLTEKAPPRSKGPKSKAPRLDTVSAPNTSTMSDEEAETLRQQLLIDKIIELELPKVIKGLLKDNVPLQLPTAVKKTLKRSNPKNKKL